MASEPPTPKYRLPLSPQDAAKIPEWEKCQLRLLEKNWAKLLRVDDNNQRVPDAHPRTVPASDREAVGRGTTVCPICLGKGETSFIEYGRDTGLSRFVSDPCQCREYRFLERYLDQHVPEKYRSLRLTSLGSDPRNVLPAEVQDTEADFIRKWASVGSFIFCGPAGCGKSSMKWALYQNQVERNVGTLMHPNRRDVEFLWSRTAKGLLDEYKVTFNNPKAKEPITKRRIESAKVRWGLRPFLAIDEFDKLVKTSSEYSVNTLFELLDEIVNHGGQFVICTNLNQQEFSDTFGQATVRRFVENAFVRDYFKPHALRYE